MLADDWDEAFPWIIFTYTEVPVDSLLFSPFDLLFGRDVKGLLQLVKQNWFNDGIVENFK